MNDRIVTRVVWLLALAFALACGVFALRIQMLGDAARSPAGAATATATVTVGDGETLWRAHCARCHEPSEFTAGLQGAQRFAAFGELLRKLDRHGNLAIRENFEVIQWLATEPADPAESPTEDEEDEEDDFSL